MIKQGLARLSQKHMSSRDYEYPALSGKGVFAYVIDSGINFKHEEFEGRAKAGKTLVPSEGFTDGTGHGTHVAGTIGSRKYGVAKKVTLIAVKIFDKDGKSSGATLFTPSTCLCGVAKGARTPDLTATGGETPRKIGVMA